MFDGVVIYPAQFGQLAADEAPSRGNGLLWALIGLSAILAATVVIYVRHEAQSKPNGRK